MSGNRRRSRGFSRRSATASCAASLCPARRRRICMDEPTMRLSPLHADGGGRSMQ
ncbi:hypothetical protein C7S16_6915 [Burkholderia thailandensis]|uniref:Uncharacterized protein n=1 Tax=Burkholderia thailandensis TaxID=57975 RepID=A0AAW9CK12_BURTH|nr:hypothetical protein [Burkholderia thailandensis]